MAHSLGLPKPSMLGFGQSPSRLGPLPDEPALAPSGTGGWIQSLLLGLLSTSWLRPDEDFWSPQAWRWAHGADTGPRCSGLAMLSAPALSWGQADLQSGVWAQWLLGGFSGHGPGPVCTARGVLPSPRATWVRTSGSDVMSSFWGSQHN